MAVQTISYDLRFSLSKSVTVAMQVTAGADVAPRIAMEILRARTIHLTWTGEKVLAAIRADKLSICGVGRDVPDALQDLAWRIQQSPDRKVWVPRSAKHYVENGKIHVDCPECGHTHEHPAG